MKPQEMFRAVEELCHESFDESTWLRWFNEALQDLTPVLKAETYDEFGINGVEERALPGDIFEIKLFLLETSNGEVKLEPVGVGEKGNKDSYWLWDGNAYFPEAKTGTGMLWYYRRPAKFTLASNRPDIREGYEDALIFYAAAKSKAPDRWLTDKSDFYGDYLMRKAQIQKERNEQLRRPRHARTASFTAGGRIR